MRLTRMRITMAAGRLAVSGTVAATVVAVAPASAVSTAVVVVNCAGQGQVRPGGYDIGCTANEMLATLHWQTWRGTADGNGVLKVDDCTPTCAQGKYIKYPVLTVLWRTERRARAPGPPLLHAGALDLPRKASWAVPGRQDSHPPRPLIARRQVNGPVMGG